MAGPTLDFWQQRYAAHDTPWDLGQPSPQLQRWLDRALLQPGQRVAVPGCGSGHDVVALAAAGLRVTAIDYAPPALSLCRAALDAAGQQADLVAADVLQWQPAVPFDAVFEQTCWCALHPEHWAAYAAQLGAWIRPGGRLLMLAMQCARPGLADGLIEGPPYHCDMHMLRALLPATRWQWNAPPYERASTRERLGHELALELLRL